MEFSFTDEERAFRERVSGYYRDNPPPAAPRWAVGGQYTFVRHIREAGGLHDRMWRAPRSTAAIALSRPMVPPSSSPCTLVYHGRAPSFGLQR